MSVVHEAVQPLRALDRLHGRTARTVPALICCIALLGGCGACGDSSSSKQEAGNIPQPGLPVPLRLVACSDWRKSSVDQRSRYVDALRMFAGGPVGSSATLKNGPVLDDLQAYRLLEASCSKRYARNFKLYHLYVRAAGFAGHQQNAGPFGAAPASKNPSGY
jgi:hypothetical protein